jgi:hypothetical protein
LGTLAFESDEQQLIAAAQRDPNRFAALYEQNVDRVYAYVVRRVRNRDLKSRRKRGGHVPSPLDFYRRKLISSTRAR